MPVCLAIYLCCTSRLQVYIYVSYRLFLLTNILKNAAVPGQDPYKVGVNMAVMGCMGAILAAIGFCVTEFTGTPSMLPRI